VLSQLSVEYMMGIVSSTRESWLLERLDKHQLTDLFVEVMGKETDKSKVKKFQLFLDRYELSGSDCLFVTDTAWDISEAQQVGISTVGVTRGFHDRKRLEAAEPDWLIDTPAELLEVSVLFTR
jgi:phosphoglycolate phosphatase